jgi:4'-phosphopantetheinyl transferase
LGVASDLSIDDLQVHSLVGAPAGVAVCSISLSPPSELVGELDAILSHDERSRAERFHFPRDASRWKTCRAALRLLLAEAVGLPGGDLVIGVEPGTTKPRWEPPDGGAASTAFNVSHSEDRALIAISPATPLTMVPARHFDLGVDLERVKHTIDVDGIARRFFSAEEQRNLATLAGREARTDYFYRCWTRKEALLKGVGIGLQGALEDFDVDAFAAVPSVPQGRGTIAPLVAGWQLHPLELETGWVAAIALKPSNERESYSSHIAGA